VVGLAFFLREVHLGMRTVRIAVYTEATSQNGVFSAEQFIEQAP
jgi:hypothetical protein